MIEQDLHIHTTYSTGDSSVVPEQTISLIAAIQHARIAGISDHFECLLDIEINNRYVWQKSAEGIVVGGNEPGLPKQGDVYPEDSPR